MYTIDKFFANQGVRKMESSRQTTVPNEHLLINLASGVMVMPGVVSDVYMNENKSSQKMLESILGGHSRFVFAVMSDPRKKDYPDKYYKTGVIADVRPTERDRVIRLTGLFRAELVRLKKISGEDWGFWVATVNQVEDENHDDYFVQSHDQVLADVMKIRDILRSILSKAIGAGYEFDSRLVIDVVRSFDEYDWGDKDEVDRFVWSVMSAVPDLAQVDKQPLIESTSLPERIGLCIKKLEKRLQLLEIQIRNTSRSSRRGKVAESSGVKNQTGQDSVEQKK